VLTAPAANARSPLKKLPNVIAGQFLQSAVEDLKS
jgi:hypothetical protein